MLATTRVVGLQCSILYSTSVLRIASNYFSKKFNLPPTSRKRRTVTLECGSLHEFCMTSFSFEIFHSIPFWHLPYSIPKFPFHSIFHSIPCPVCRFFIIIIAVTFNPNGCSQFENPEAPDFKKIASASSSFSTLLLLSSLPLPTSSIKVLLQKN